MLRKLAILATIFVALFLIVVVVTQLLGDKPDPPADDEFVGAVEQFDPENVKPLEDPSAIGTSSGGWIRSLDDKNRVREFRYDQLEPLAEYEFDVVGPMARLYLSPQQVVQITAATGRIIAPDNFPQSGTFRGGVVVTIFKNERAEGPDLTKNSPDRALTIELDDAVFDAQSGKIDSLGAVRLVAPRAEFTGRGMKLVFNEAAGRINYLEIIEGNELRFRPDQSTKKDGAPDEADNEPPSAEVGDKKTHYYRAQFGRDVVINYDGSTIKADTLTALFALRLKRSEETLAADRVPGNLLAQVGGEPTLAEPEPEMVMNWKGRMIVRPVEQRPRVLRNDSDFQLVLSGKPVELTGKDRDRITCARLEYLDSLQKVDAIGEGAVPLAVDAPRFGVVEAERIQLRLEERVATLLGRGMIAAPPDKAEGDEEGLPAGFAVRWSKRVDLELPEDDEDNESIRSADFQGDVRIDDKQFLMEGDRLKVTFELAPGGKKRRVSEVLASGGVKITSDEGNIAGEHLHLTITGGKHPAKLRAKGAVSIGDPTQSIKADTLDVTFTKPFVDPEDGKEKVDVLTAVADGEVVVGMEDGTRVAAEQLTVDGAKGSAFLTGSAARPVTVKQENMTLKVPVLAVSEDGGLAQAKGAGEFVLDEPADEKHPDGRKVRVTWTEMLDYNEGAQKLEITGEVVAEGEEKADQVNRLSAERVTLHLVKVEGEDKDAVDERQLLRSMQAAGKVVLLSTTWQDTGRERVASRLRIGGERLEFNNATERARVIGKGTMLVEDYRPTKSNKDRGAVSISGRGVTLFTWAKSMTLDGAATDLMLDGSVNMTHKPADKKQRVVEMQCDKLLADMKGVGGLKALETSEIESLDIDEIRATGAVRLREAQRVITAEVLRYLGSTQTVHLDAAVGRNVQIIDITKPKPTRAKKIRWDLKRDRFIIDQPGF